MLKAVSPVDGRYESKTKKLQEYFSEYALIKYRVIVEVKYLIHLINNNIGGLGALSNSIKDIEKIASDFNEADAQKIKDTERTTNHDVKAVEYFVKDKLVELKLDDHIEWVHFALTSQDINNTAVPLSLKAYFDDVFFEDVNKLIQTIKSLAKEYHGVPMLARTHGQAASPTTVGKEFMVFVERLENQFDQLKALQIYCKFGGATGNFNAHKVSFPDVNWPEFADGLISSMGLKRHKFTTQIAHYDDLAAIFNCIQRFNNILIDLARDIWTYVSMDYFKQKVIANEVGSSAMPHKVNPIDFENAEGNLGMANAIFAFLSEKLPVSRLQRDLTDSTVLRNIGVPLAHTSIAFQSLNKGFSKLMLNREKLEADLEQNWAVVAEAIQNILRREAYPKPYEALKALTRGNARIDQASIHAFIKQLDLSDEIKDELLQITPHNYIGYTS